MSQIPPYQQPPGYSNYPRNPSGQSYQRPPGVYFENIGDAWNLVQKNLSTWILTMLICGAMYFAVVFAVEMILVISTTSLSGVGPARTIAPSLSILLIAIPVFLIIACVFQVIFAGLMMMAVKQARGEPISIGDAFSHFPDIVSIVIAGFLSALAIGIGTLCCLVPGLWLTGIFVFVPMLAADRKLGPIEVLELSYNTLRPYAWPLFALHFVANLIGSAGMALCGVGMLITFPIYVSIMGLAYNNFFPKQVQDNYVYNQPIGFEPPR